MSLDEFTASRIARPTGARSGWPSCGRYGGRCAGSCGSICSPANRWTGTDDGCTDAQGDGTAPRA